MDAEPDRDEPDALAARFAGVRSWVFDLDNTLYPREARLFELIEPRIETFIADALGVGAAEARFLRVDYWRRYGTTMAGLVAHHGIAAETYARFVHDVPLATLAPAPHLAARIAALPGRRVVHTNGPRFHAERVLDALGLAASFDAVYCIEDAGYVSKPEAEAYGRVWTADGIAPAQAAMFEDDPRNLAAPHAHGMRTVLVGAEGGADAHVGHVTDDLARFLARLA